MAYAERHMPPSRVISLGRQNVAGYRFWAWEGPIRDARDRDAYFRGGDSNNRLHLMLAGAERGATVFVRNRGSGAKHGV